LPKQHGTRGAPDVAGASYENGLLSVELEQEIPEAMKPRRIEIATSQDAQRVRNARRDENEIEDAA
jgi:molecular chaperone IbpA